MGKQLIFDEKLAWKTTDELGSPKDFGNAIYALFASRNLRKWRAGLLPRQELDDFLPAALALGLKSRNLLTQQCVNVHTRLGRRLR